MASPEAKGLLFLHHLSIERWVMDDGVPRLVHLQRPEEWPLDGWHGLGLDWVVLFQYPFGFDRQG